MIFNDRSNSATLRVLNVAGLFMALVVYSGCQKQDWGYVTGTVTVDGQPVGPGTLVFEPADKERRNAPSSLAYFDEQGQFEVVSVGKQKGAQAGKYYVVIMEGAPGVLADENAPAQVKPSQIPPRYSDYDAGLTAHIEPGDQVIDFPLTK